MENKLRFTIAYHYFFMVLVILLFTANLVCADTPEDSRGIKLLEQNLGKGCKVGKQYLVLIGIDKYKQWMPLKNAVKDAKDIREILESRYYIDHVYELYNEEATKEKILKLFADLKQTLQTHDSLLIYYAGHGHLDEVTKTGFWIPVNGGTNKFEQANWLPVSQVRGILGDMPVIHILLISDSCFSGNILETNRGSAPEISNEYFKKAYSLVSRQVLTSGSSETVPDESAFSQQLKLALRKNTSPYLDPLMLYNDIRLGVRTTTPLFGSLRDTGHQDGASFLLFLKTEEISVEQLPDMTSLGSLAIEINRNAGLYIDDQFVLDLEAGKTEVKNLPSGKHTVTVVFPDGQKEIKDIDIPADKITNLMFHWKEFEQEKPLVRNFLSVEVGSGMTVPVIEMTDVMESGINTLVSAQWNINTPYGIIGFGASTGFLQNSTVDSVEMPYNLSAIPLSARFEYATSFLLPFFVFMEADAGVMLNFIHFTQPVPELEDKVTLKMVIMPGIGAGYKISENLNISLWGNVMLIMFNETMYSSLSLGLKVGLFF